MDLHDRAGHSGRWTKPAPRGDGQAVQVPGSSAVWPPSSVCYSFLAGLGTTGYQSAEVLVPAALGEMNPWALL